MEPIIYISKNNRRFNPILGNIISPYKDPTRYYSDIYHDILKNPSFCKDRGSPSIGYDYFLDKLSKDTIIYAVINNNIVGALTVHFDHPHGIMSGICVPDNKIYRGIGEILIHKLIEIATLMNITDITLTCLGQKLKKYYTNLGFELKDDEFSDIEEYDMYPFDMILNLSTPRVDIGGGKRRSKSKYIYTRRSKKTKRKQRKTHKR